MGRVLRSTGGFFSGGLHVGGLPFATELGAWMSTHTLGGAVLTEWPGALAYVVVCSTESGVKKLGAHARLLMVAQTGPDFPSSSGDSASCIDMIFRRLQV